LAGGGSTADVSMSSDDADDTDDDPYSTDDDDLYAKYIEDEDQ
jgi:hypothetical protein